MVLGLVCSMAQPSPWTEVTAILNVTGSLSQGTTIAFRLPCPVAYCSIALETTRGEPVAVNSIVSSCIANLCYTGPVIEPLERGN